MVLAEQIRSRGQRQERPAGGTGIVAAQPTNQENVNAAVNAVDAGTLAYVEQGPASFSTSLALSYEPKGPAGAAAQFYRGSKPWSAVAISNVTGLSASLLGLSDAAAGKVLERIVTPVHKRVPPCGALDVLLGPSLRKMAMDITHHFTHVGIVVVGQIRLRLGLLIATSSSSIDRGAI